MLSRQLLISTCALALIATPALPQTSPPQSAQQRASPAATLSTPATMRAALRAWGLDRQSRAVGFTKGQVTADSAQFNALSILENDGTRTTLDNLIITRNNTAGPDFGTFAVQGSRFAQADGSIIGTFSIAGLRGDGNLLQSLSSTSQPSISNPRRTRNPVTADLFAQAITMTDLKLVLPEGAGITLGRFTQMEFSGVQFGGESIAFEAMTLRGGVLESKEFDTKIAAVTMRGFSTASFQSAVGGNDAGSKALDFLKLALGGLSIEGLTYTFKTVDGKAPPLDTLSLGRFSMDDVKDGLVGNFSMVDLKFGGGVGAKAWEGSLGRFGLTRLNMRYFDEFGRTLAKFFPTLDIANTPPPTDPSKPAPPSVAVVQPATPTIARPPILLKDLLPAGPLDGGIQGLDMSAFKVSAAGFDFTIDQAGLTQERNADGIAIRSDMIPTTMRLTWPTVSESSLSVITNMLADFDIDQIALRFSGGATYEPSTDLVSVSDYRLELLDWGDIRFDFAMSGISKLYAKATLSDILSASMAVQPKPGAKPGMTPKEQLGPLAALYSDIAINSARTEIVDKGGLDRGIKIFIKTSGGGSTERVVSGEQVRDRRMKLAQSARTEAGKKTAPAFMRQAALAFARWIEGGGSMAVEIKPAAPLYISEFASDVPPQIERWGLRFLNTPAQRPATQTPPRR
jgi:hypothetical protein